MLLVSPDDLVDGRLSEPWDTAETPKLQWWLLLAMSLVNGEFEGEGKGGSSRSRRVDVIRG